jgi:hypothetical protein
MKKKVSKKKAWSPSGNNIQIRYERRLNNEYVVEHTLVLQVVSLDFQSAIDDEWRGDWKGEQIWVKFTRPGWETLFSDNFPSEHKSAAYEEVRRIERQFN